MLHKKSFVHAEEVSFINTNARITLSGTLTIPAQPGTHPAVILIAGMGPMDRDYTFGNHKMFAILADHLSRNGIVVLRYDKRGVGQSTGTFDLNATSQDLADDVQAGLAYLASRPEINQHKIGLIGHSEGGLIASIVASRQPTVAFAVLLAGAVVNSTEGLVAQTAVQLTADGASSEMIAQDGSIRAQILATINEHADVGATAPILQALFDEYWAQLPQAQQKETQRLHFAFSAASSAAVLGMMNSPWYRFLLTHDSATTLAHITAPVLALYGERDFMAPHLMIPFVRAAMEQGNNKNYTLLAMPNLNHSMQTCQTGALAEYATITETIAPIVLKTVADWIVQQTK